MCVNSFAEALFLSKKILIKFSNHAKYDMFTWYTPRERRGQGDAG